MEKKHIPGRLQISTECNHECVFCSIPGGPVDKPDFEEIKRRITELKSLGTNDLFITGGEPTMHPRFLEVVDFAYKTGFYEITIQTNATNLSKHLLQSMKKYDNVKFNFSFHSFEEMVCDRLSAKKHYQRILEGIKNMCEMGFGGYPTIVITTLNYRKLKEHIIFIRKNFPSITHFSFNFVDPSGRARQNKWVVPTLWESERYIHETMRYLKDNGLTFRLERVPLCYMQGFEEFSTEIRLHTKGEKRLTYFAKEIPGKKNMTIEYSKQGEYIKTDACKACFLKDLCPGINPNYADVHGISEVYPVFTNPNSIIDRINKSSSYMGSTKVLPEIDKTTDKKDDFDENVEMDLKLFKKAIEEKPNKNNLYDTYSYFQMSAEGLKDTSYIFNAWKGYISRVREGKAPDLFALYIHFPYCQSLCDYCIYPSTLFEGDDRVDRYIEQLRSDMILFSPLFEGIRLKAFYMGGGSPSIMKPEQLKRLLGYVHKYFKFDTGAEKAVEFNPNTTSFEKLRVLESYGFNKLSMGVQSFSESVLRENNRNYQTLEKVRQAVEDFRKTSIGYLNLDMLIGLKGDSTEEFLSSFEQVCKLKPNLISIYPLKTNKKYIETRYGGDFKRFQDYYYPLFDSVVKGLPEIAKRHGYTNYEDHSKLSYVHPLDFSLKNQPERVAKHVYVNFRKEFFSNLGLGFYAESCIHDVMRYTKINRKNPEGLFLKGFSTEENEFSYAVFRLSPNFHKVKFITHSVYENFAVIREKYKEMFESDIAEDFPYAVKALERFGVAELDDLVLRFKTSDEKELYPYLLFFVGREDVLKRSAG